ncbi:4-aminobutyrate aminotransferase [Trichonephila clavata]|uniref:4-aminobutyrate aminotransferase n=1 Tax=Trichonephila clavata TaxID=2740835 RepID=A0A8X6LUT3_TRICU|nr:4-aminobutyrate aminotransferase [Trichonephila clavata]
MKTHLRLYVFWYKNKERGGKPPSEQELRSCMVNEFPGAANLSILSFMGGFHGRTLEPLLPLILTYSQAGCAIL